MTEGKKSQGPSLATVAASAVLLCAVLVAAAAWLRDDEKAATADPSPLAASTLQTFYDRCEGELSRELVDGRTRLRCETKEHPAFLLQVVLDGEQIESAKMLMPPDGSTNEQLDRILTGLEMFGLMAGVRPEDFLPKEYLDAVGTSKTGLVYQGRAYSTRTIPNVGMIFGVTPEPAGPAKTN